MWTRGWMGTVETRSEVQMSLGQVETQLARITEHLSLS